jgi:hypothetical protein
MAMTTGLIAGVLMASTAGHIGQIEKKTVGETCEVRAIADDGPLKVVVTWAACHEIDIRVMSVADLRDAGQLDSLPARISGPIMRDLKRVVLTAWGEFTASIYLRSTEGGTGTTEIAIAD